MTDTAPAEHAAPTTQETAMTTPDSIPLRPVPGRTTTVGEMEPGARGHSWSHPVPIQKIKDDPEERAAGLCQIVWQDDFSHDTVRASDRITLTHNPDGSPVGEGPPPHDGVWLVESDLSTSVLGWYRGRPSHAMCSNGDSVDWSHLKDDWPPHWRVVAEVDLAAIGGAE